MALGTLQLWYINVNIVATWSHIRFACIHAMKCENSAAGFIRLFFPFCVRLCISPLIPHFCDLIGLRVDGMNDNTVHISQKCHMSRILVFICAKALLPCIHGHYGAQKCEISHIPATCCEKCTNICQRGQDNTSTQSMGENSDDRPWGTQLFQFVPVVANN